MKSGNLKQLIVKYYKKVLFYKMALILVLRAYEIIKYGTA